MWTKSARRILSLIQWGFIRTYIYSENWKNGDKEKARLEFEIQILDETFAEKEVRSEEWKQEEEESVTDGATLVDAI